MKKIDKRIRVGTLVIVEGSQGWWKVAKVGGHLIHVYGLGGSFQQGHIVKFTNNKGTK